jgi:hypothetical protein
MRKHLRRPSPATAIAMIALFVALGGTGYAAATGSIDSREIRNNTVQGKDIRNSTIQGADVRNNTLTGSDVAESKLGKVPSAANADSASNAAAVGGLAPGTFAREVQYLTATSTDTGQTKQVFINCPAGKSVIGGGSQITGNDQPAYLQTDRPIVNNTQWFGQARGVLPADTGYGLTATVICARIQ